MTITLKSSEKCAKIPVIVGKRIQEGTAAHSREAYFAFPLCVTATPDQDYGILVGRRRKNFPLILISKVFSPVLLCASQLTLYPCYGTSWVSSIFVVFEFPLLNPRAPNSSMLDGTTLLCFSQTSCPHCTVHQALLDPCSRRKHP